MVHTPPVRKAASLSPRARKIWLTAHVAISVGWLGAAYTMFVLGLTALRSTDATFRIAVYEIMHLFDIAVNLPLFTGMLVTGLVVSLRTKWGLFRHWWVCVKLVLSLLVGVGTPLLSVPRVESMLAAIPAGTPTGSTAFEIVAISVGTITVLTTVTGISVFKPWGRIRRMPFLASNTRAIVHRRRRLGRGLPRMTDSDVSSWEPPPGIDTRVTHSARVWNYWLGGKDNYPVDRESGAQIQAYLPSIVDIARADRAFLAQAVRHLAGEAGIRQFLDVGTGLPTADNTHEVAQAVVPTSRIVYVDNDPMVLAHARALLTSTPEGVTDYIDADVRAPDVILTEAARTLDFTQPIALMLLGIMNHILENGEAYAIVDRLLDALPSGSYLALTHPTADIDGDAVRRSMAWMNEHGRLPITARSHQEVTRFFAGLELLDPGVVSTSLWRSDPTDLGSPLEVAQYCGVARKP